MGQLTESPSGFVYTLKENVWIRAGDRDIWIINGKLGLTVTVWGAESEELIDAIYLQGEQWNTTS